MTITKMRISRLTMIVMGVAGAFCGTGCGKGSDSSSSSLLPPVPVNTGSGYSNSICPPGAGSIGGGPCLGGDFNTVCRGSGGQPFSGGCRIEKNGYFQLSTGGYYYSLSTGSGNNGAPQGVMTGVAYPGDGRHLPSLSGGMGGINTNILLRHGDLLSVNASGTYGTLKDFTFVFSLNGDTSSNSCNDFDISTGGSLSSGSAMGLVATDGVELFTIGGGVSSKPVNHDGYLRMGFNLPTTKPQCARATVSLNVIHCEDTSGNSVTCPF